MTPDEIYEVNPEALFCSGFDDAIIGFAERINLGPVAAYSTEKILNIMMERDGMSYGEAVEYFQYNVLGSWVGDFTPVFITTNS